MAGIDLALALAFEHRMAGDQLSILGDPVLGLMVLNLDDPPPCGVGLAVLIAADSDHTFLANPALDGWASITASPDITRSFISMNSPVGGTAENPWSGSERISKEGPQITFAGSLSQLFR